MRFPPCRVDMPPISSLGGIFLNVIDDENWHAAPGRYQLQSELLLEGVENEIAAANMLQLMDHRALQIGSAPGLYVGRKYDGRPKSAARHGLMNAKNPALALNTWRG